MQGEVTRHNCKYITVISFYLYPIDSTWTSYLEDLGESIVKLPFSYRVSPNNKYQVHPPLSFPLTWLFSSCVVCNMSCHQIRPHQIRSGRELHTHKRNAPVNTGFLSSI